MKFIEFFIKKSLLVNLISLFLVIAGFISMWQLKREAFPEVSFDVVVVDTVYKGACAEEIEKLITTPLEEKLREVDDIDEINSYSSPGLSRITLKIDPDVKDKGRVVNDIQRAVDRVTNLPQDLNERPSVTEITSKQIPVIKVSLSGRLNEFALRNLAQRLKDRFEDIEGVASVKRIGWRDEEYWVEPDINKLKEYHVSLKEIMAALKWRNVTIPAGKLRTKGEEFVLKTTDEFSSKEEIENVVIRANDLGNWLKIKDLARVRHTVQEETVINKTGGSRSITLTVIKRQKADAIELVDKVKKTIAQFRKEVPAELNISSFYDFSYYIKRRLKVLRSNGIIAFILVVGFLFLLLHPIPALFTSLGIPVAIFTTFWMMNILGMSINLITMFGLIVVLGMLVDDAIIISENVYRYVEEGLCVKEAVIRGTSEVIAPVFSTVATTIAAFSPLLFMSGLIGRFIRQIPLVVIVALCSSLLEAFIILPNHLFNFIGSPKLDSVSKRQPVAESWFNKLLIPYRRILDRALQNRYKIAAAIFGLFLFSIFLAKYFMPFILFSARGIEQFQIRAEAPLGTSLEKTEELIRPVEEVVQTLPPKYLNTYETQIGRIFEERGFDPNAKEASNLAQITVYLTPAQQRDKSAKEIIEELRPALGQIKGFKKLYFSEFKEGPPVGKPIDVKVRGDNFRILEGISQAIETYLKTLKGIKDISNDYDLGSRQLCIVVDEKKATKSYLTLGDIASSIRYAFEGGVATTIKQSRAEEEIKIRVRLPKKQRDNLQVFDNLLIPNKMGNLIPLKRLAAIEYSQSVNSIRHLNGRRVISVTAQVDNRNITSVRANALLRKKFAGLSKQYPGYSLKFSGEQEETIKSLRGLLTAFWIAIFLIFIMLATVFNSLIQPLIVLLIIPLGFIGVIFAFLLHNEPLSFLAILGIVGLSGVMVNDSIVFAYFINALRAKGINRRESIVQAGALRLRPIILTSVTTVGGLATVAYGIGGSDPFLKPMALAISWGLAFATVLTLLVMPCIYAIVDDISASLKRKFLK
jgi:multidrug efflux pump subunit AcrB